MLTLLKKQYVGLTTTVFANMYCEQRNTLLMTQSSQNKSHAVMAQRSEAKDSPDNFPTPPWATRAILQDLSCRFDLKSQSCLEPACGAGHMSKVLNEYFQSVSSSDLYNYGFGGESDFLTHFYGEDMYDWVITNPPFRSAEDFVIKALDVAQIGVACLVRTGFLESVGRYDRLFSNIPPTFVAQFSERVPMVKGRLDMKATTATAYAWMVWEKHNIGTSRLQWIKPCRKALEQDGDYLEPISSAYVK